MKAFIFDLDGTLLDSMDVWDRIDAEFLAKRGIELPDNYLADIYSMSFPEAALYTVERFGLDDTPEDLIDEWNNMAVNAYGNAVELKPHAREYLEYLRMRGAKLAVATGLPACLYEPALENLGIAELFDVICSTDDVDCSKTTPDVFLLAAQRMDAEPSECVVFEDLLAAVQSAREAGMTVYGVYDEANRGRWQEIEKTADGVIYSFADAPRLR